MKKPAFLLPMLLVLAGTAQAQESGACPQLPADAGLTWEQLDSGGSNFCRALRSDGSEAFGMVIAADSPFDPQRRNRDRSGTINGREIRWYRAEIAAKPDVVALETLVEIGNGRVAHIWLQSTSEQQLAAVLQATRDLQFNAAVRPDAQVARGQ